MIRSTTEWNNIDYALGKIHLPGDNAVETLREIIFDKTWGKAWTKNVKVHTNSEQTKLILDAEQWLIDNPDG